MLLGNILGTLPAVICFIVAVIFYKRIKPTWLKPIVYYLGFTIIIMALSIFWAFYLKRSNHFIYNIYFPVAFLFYFFLFTKGFETAKEKKIIYLFTLIYLLVVLIDMILFNGINYFNNYAFCAGAILIIICTLIYFIKLFLAEGIVNYFKIPMFWISMGLLFFYVGSLVLMALLPYLISNHLGNIYGNIMHVLNCLLYFAIIAGFLCNQTWKKTR